MACGNSATPVGKCRKQGYKEVTIGSLVTFTSGDAFTTLISIDGASNATDKGGVITDIFVYENNTATLQKSDFDFFISKKTFTGTPVESTFAVDISLTQDEIIGRFSLTNSDYLTNSDTTYATARITPNIPFVNSADTTLYYQPIIMGADGFPSGAKIAFKFLIDRD